MRYTIYHSGPLSRYDRHTYRLMAAGILWGPPFRTVAAAHHWAQAQGWQPS